MVYIVPMPVYSITGMEVRQDRFAGKGQADLGEESGREGVSIQDAAPWDTRTGTRAEDIREYRASNAQTCNNGIPNVFFPNSEIQARLVLYPAGNHTSRTVCFAICRVVNCRLNLVDFCEYAVIVL